MKELTPEHRETVEKHRHLWTRLSTGSAINPSHQEREELREVFTFITGRTTNIGCKSCIKEMFGIIYNTYKITVKKKISG